MKNNGKRVTSKKTKRKVLVTGGAGYIGSHMVRVLLEAGYEPVVFDNLSTGHRSFIPRHVPFVRGDVRVSKDVERVFKRFRISAVIHFAAALVVPESVVNPQKYYDNNVVGTFVLTSAMLKFKIYNLIVSSTAAVYGEPKKIPVTEREPAEPVNPYGMSKLVEEYMLHDISNATPLKYISLRYFNVAGAHPSGEVGIRNKNATHLVPSILKVACGKRRIFTIFGNNYPTKDGTCIRDFIYVLDLCDAHLRALKKLNTGTKREVINLGNGSGFSVKEVLCEAERVVGKKISMRIATRREGDPARIVASSKKARTLLGWKPTASLRTIIETAWHWELAEKKKGR